MLIFGERKIGKTSLCAQIDDAFFFPCEPGTKALKVYQPMEEDGTPIMIQDLKTMRQWVNAFLADDQYVCAVIDTIDALYNMAKVEVCDKYAIDDPSEVEWGAAWSAITDRVREIVDLILYSNKGLILLSHATVKEIETFDGDTIEQLRCTLSGKTGDYITGVVDFWAYYGYSGNDRELYIRGNQQLDAGTRLEEHFNCADTQEPLSFIPMGTNPKESYQNLIKAFNNELDDPTPPPRKKKRRKKKKNTDKK